MSKKANEKPQGLMDIGEARREGIDVPEPKETVCEWCGKPREPLGMVGLGGAFHWISARPCNCEGARAQLAKEEAEDRARKEKGRREAFSRCGVKRRFMEAQVSHPAASSYLNAFSENPGVGLYIAGPSRAGKTYTASALAKAFCLYGYKTLLTTSLAMLDSIKESFDGDPGRGISKFSSADILIIDDLGKENANSWVMTTLFQIVNERYEAMRPTIVTSQYLPEELKRRMSRSGEKESATAIVERLKETCRLLRLPPRKNVHLMEDVPRDA